MSQSLFPLVGLFIQSSDPLPTVHTNNCQRQFFDMVVVVHFDVDACFQSAACSMFIPRWLIPAWSVHRLMKWFLNSAQTVWDLYTRTAAPCCCLTLCSIKGERVQFCLFLSFQFRKHRSVGQSVDHELWEEKKEKKNEWQFLAAAHIVVGGAIDHHTALSLSLHLFHSPFGQLNKN